MAAPGTFTSGQVLTAAEMNALPGAVMDYERNTDPNTTPGSLTTSQQTYVTCTFTAVTGRLYLAIGAMSAESFDAAGVFEIRLETDTATSTCGQLRIPAPSTSLDFVGATASGYFVGSGSVTVEMKARLIAGATSANVAVTSNIDPYLMILDVGPS